jgi:hypothetical protein
MRSFYEIGLDSISDKIISHRYDRFYPRFLDPLRDKSFNMLEIGIDQGGSYKIWEEYFPKATIYGFDINQEWESFRGKVFQLDQSNYDHLKKALDLVPKCDLIIDDGSHNPTHQLDTFFEFFENLLNYGGIYIIEDTECSYWRPETVLYGYKKGYFNLIDYFKSYPDVVNSMYSKRKNELHISSITFGQNCIIITKKTQEEIEFTNQIYNLTDWL